MDNALDAVITRENQIKGRAQEGRGDPTKVRQTMVLRWL